MIKRLVESSSIKTGCYISIKKFVNGSKPLIVYGIVQEINQAGFWVYKSLYGYH